MKIIEKKSSTKWPQIASELRRRIVSGELTPGSRLPTRPQLSKLFQVSEGTAQVVLDELSNDRFIETRGRLGTYVADYPPHLSHYAVVFPWNNTPDQEWSKFHSAIRQATNLIRLPRNCQSTLYVGTQKSDDRTNFNKLVRDVESDCVAGLIFATDPYPFIHTPVLDRPNIPRIAICNPVAHCNFPCIYPDFHSWYHRAFELIALKKWQRIAVLMPSLVCTQGDQLIHSHARQHGLTIAPQFIQYGLVNSPHSAFLIERQVHLLMTRPVQERPEVLLLSDDNLLEPAIEGVIKAGCRIGHDVHLLTHCNFPWPKPAGVPLIRLGFDVPAMLRLCVQSITNQRAGEKVPNELLIPAQFDHELGSP